MSLRRSAKYESDGEFSPVVAGQVGGVRRRRVWVGHHVDVAEVKRLGVEIAGKGESEGARRESESGSKEFAAQGKSESKEFAAQGKSESKSKEIAGRGESESKDPSVWSNRVWNESKSKERPHGS